MRLLKFSGLLFLLCLVSISLQAQAQPATASINEGTINDQFEFIINKSNNYTDGKGQSYEVVRRNIFLTLKAHTLDSLNALQAKLDNTNNKVSSQQKKIDELTTKLADTESTLATTTEEKDGMVLLGMQMTKTSYNIIMWSTIAGLLAFLLIFIYRFKNSNVVTKATKASLADLENEFKEHRRIALEREQKVKRQLQDEINKQRE